MFRKKLELLLKKWNSVIEQNKCRFDYESELLIISYILNNRFSDEENYNAACRLYNVLLDQLYISVDIQQEIKKDIAQVRGKISKNEFFVTVGFDDNTITIDKIIKCVKSLKEMSGVNIDHLTVEKFRKKPDGLIYTHHHIHFLVSTDYAKSKVVQFIFQKVNKFVQSKNFVDVKPLLEIHKKYVLGIKKEDKMECVKLDEIWRKENNLEEIIF